MDLGFERAGFTVSWQVEKDDWCRKVLAKHWPNVKRYEDVTTLTGEELEPVDLICGGFPCQPVSHAGQQKGTNDDRWLWPEFQRLVGVLRPRYVLVENVPGLFTANDGHAFGAILGDLADLGYDAEWTVLSAADVGAPHLRKRVWIVAHADRREQSTDRRVHRRNEGQPERHAQDAAFARTQVAHADDTQSGGAYLAHADGTRLERRGLLSQRADQRAVGATGLDDRRIFAGPIGGTWEPESNIRRVAHGVRNRVDRLKGLGNAVVPQVVEWIGKRIVESDQ
tara:strand:+ start:2861 stop:3706 length:846 start_codon:yes stop_codon:yes gene_type:complete